MLKEENDSGNWQFGSKGADQVVVEMERANMFETSGDVLKDLDGILAGRADAMAAVEPGSNGQDDNHKGIAED